MKRRGEDCLHIKFGNDYAINSSSGLYFLPMLRMKEFVPRDKQLDVYETYFNEVVNVHVGQAFDIHWHNGKTMPTQEQYLYMVTNKTSVLPRLGASLLEIIIGVPKEHSKAIQKYIESLGAAF